MNSYSQIDRKIADALREFVAENMIGCINAIADAKAMIPGASTECGNPPGWGNVSDVFDKFVNCVVKAIVGHGSTEDQISAFYSVSINLMSLFASHIQAQRLLNANYKVNTDAILEWSNPANAVVEETKQQTVHHYEREPGKSDTKDQVIE